MNIPIGRNVSWMVFTTTTPFPVKRSHGAPYFNDQSRDDVVAAAHKNMSLGCRNISVVETYRRGDAPCPPVLIPGHDTLSDRIFPQRTLSFLYRFALEKHGTDRRRSAKKNGSTRRASLIVLIISVTQSIRRAVSWLPASLRNFSILSSRSAAGLATLLDSSPSSSFFVPFTLDIRSHPCLLCSLSS